MSDTSGTIFSKKNGRLQRTGRPVTTVSSHMVNYPVCLQADRPERMRQSLLSARPACRARSVDAGTYTEFSR